ncbi:MAG: hypothetical protein SOZ48_03835 [Eubacterium sp.]|nr:hypothetical protein [Eubacterium sp.]
MGKKREMARQCALIRELIDANKYTLALQEIDSMNLKEVPSIGDLYLFAELYEKAERMDKKKEIFYAIYERTHSRHILYQLLRLVIRMGDMEEARELFLAYEVVGGITLDTYELRYRLARAEGEPRTRLIEILEDLKKEEYTEEWGYQLALLYEMEGERQKCIQECEDLKLWFGEGKIVDKAMELKARCEDKDWQPPAEEEIPEPVEPDVEETFAYAAPPVEVTELAEETETEAETAEDKEEESETETLSAKIPESLSEGVSEPVVTKKAEPLEVKPQRQPVEDLEAMLAEDPEDISERGIRYHTLKNTINHIKYEKKEAHFVFAGGEERITLAVAKRVAKELNHVGYFSAQSIVKITAEKLNALNLAEQAEKLRGGCMLVTNAPELTKEAVEELIALIKDNGEDIVVMLSGPFDEMDCILGIYPELSEILTYKVRM